MDGGKYNSLRELESKLGYSFREIRHLYRALTHRSRANESPFEEIESNERYEFLGDAVLDLVIGHILMDRFKERKEGELSRLRASIVNEKALAHIARSLDIGKYLLLGKGEERTKGREKDSILANAYEAILAAVYLDGGFDEAFSMVKRHFSDLLKMVDEVHIPFEDYKSRLQEYTQMYFREKPSYELISTSGPEHKKTFQVRLKVGSRETIGTGKTKKDAEQMAARKMLELFNI